MHLSSCTFFTWCDTAANIVGHRADRLPLSRFGSSNLLAKMRQIFSQCFELYASEFFEEQPLFEDLLGLEDANGQTVLYHAIRSGDKECVQLLLSHNISPIDRFESEKVQRLACFCGVSACREPQAPNIRGAKNSKVFCVCQPSHRLFPFLIMSLDLRPMLKTSSRPKLNTQSDTQRFSSSSFAQGHVLPDLPPPRLLESFLSPPSHPPPLHHAEAYGNYRILDVDTYNFSADDSKRMWRRCRDNVVSFANPSAKDAISLQFGNQMHLTLNSLDNNGKGELQMHSSFKNARKEFEQFDANNADAKGAAAVGDGCEGIAHATRRLMFFSFCFLSDGWKLQDGWSVSVEEVRHLAEFAAQRLDVEKQKWLDLQIWDIKEQLQPQLQQRRQRRFSIFTQNSEKLDEISSRMFMLANALFNCCVALKMSHCTQASFHPF
jgi:ankyrin repeat protein